MSRVEPALIEKGLGLGRGLNFDWDSGEMVFMRFLPLAALCKIVLLLDEFAWVSQFLHPLHLQASVHGTPNEKHSQ